jgi:hypothetical protein
MSFRERIEAAQAIEAELRVQIAGAELARLLPRRALSVPSATVAPPAPAAVLGVRAKTETETEDAKSKLCPFAGCGSTNPSDAKFCMSCGRELDDDEDPEEDDDDDDLEPEDDDEAEKAARTAEAFAARLNGQFARDPTTAPTLVLPSPPAPIPSARRTANATQDRAREGRAVREPLPSTSLASFAAPAAAPGKATRPAPPGPRRGDDVPPPVLDLTPQARRERF